MRSLVGIIATIATVIHFTFGCCLHPCHASGRGDCVTLGIEAAACEDCCHAHDHSRDHARDDAHDDDHADAACEAAGGSCEHDGVSLVAAPAGDACHGCEGCHCAATSTETGTTFPWPQEAAVIVPDGDGSAFAPFADARERQLPDPDVHPCPGRNPLFERFLI